MSWQEIEKIEPVAVDRGTGIRASVFKRKKGTARLRLTILAAPLGEIGWKDGDRLAVFVGAEDEAGKLRLAKNKSGAAALARKTGPNRKPFFRIDLGPLAGVPDRREMAKSCDWAHDGAGAIVITLPDWAPALSATAQSLAVKTEKRDVAPRLMGDPAPGRSALDQKRGGVR